MLADGIETVRAEFVAPEALDSVGALAPLSRWVAEQHSGAGLRRVSGDGPLKPFVGHRRVLFGMTV